MSLINKMLQDLDARGTRGPESMASQVAPVRAERRLPVALIAGGVAAVVAVAIAGGVLGWRYLHKPAAVVALPRQPVKVEMKAPPPAPAPAVAVVAEAPPPAPAPAPPVVAEAPPAKVEAPPQVEVAPAPPPEAVAEPARRVHKTRKERREEKAKRAAEREVRAAAAKQAKAVQPKIAKRPAADEGRQESANQRAEGGYRNALASLQEGRVAEAIAALEQVLKLDPRHDAARQTLVGLLIENHRADEAMRHLQLGLALDPRQPALAMLLARLQIERGGPGIDTLLRTLPYAAGNGEYHAFLAGALQRQQRHREAAEQYQAALRAAPGNGVWWMGLGISLQAEKRNAEAADAYQKAKAVGTLSPELLAFVERKLQQLR